MPAQLHGTPHERMVDDRQLAAVVNYLEQAVTRGMSGRR